MHVGYVYVRLNVNVRENATVPRHVEQKHEYARIVVQAVEKSKLLRAAFVLQMHLRYIRFEYTRQVSFPQEAHFRHLDIGRRVYAP